MTDARSPLPLMPRADALTVVVTCYNHATFIAGTLRSIWEQSLEPAEILVIDDASTDSSVREIETAAKAAPVQIRLIKRVGNSGGPARPSNEVVEAARTPVVAIVEGDDTCVPNRLARQFAALMTEPDSPLCFGLTETVGADDVVRPEYSIPLEEILGIQHREAAPGLYGLNARDLYRHMLEQRNVVASFSNMMFRKDAWAHAGGFRERYKVCLDLDFVCRCCALGEVMFVADVTCRHRLHGANVGGASGIRNRRDLITCKADYARDPVLPGAAPDLERQLSDLLLSQAYWEARDGMLPESLRSYARAVRHGASPGLALSGAAKAIPHAAMARMRRRQGR